MHYNYVDCEACIHYNYVDCEACIHYNYVDCEACIHASQSTRSGCWELFAWSWCVQGVKLATHFHAVLGLRKELYLHSPICLYVMALNWSHDSFNLYVYWLLIIILFCGAQNILLNISAVDRFDHLRFPDTERGCLLEFGGLTSQYSVTFTVMGMRTSNVKLVILTGKILSCNMVEYKMYRAHIHSSSSHVIGEKAWQAGRLLW